MTSTRSPRNRPSRSGGAPPPDREGRSDHVRLLWEDVAEAAIQAPFLQSLLEYLEGQGRGLRVLEIGCGAGEGLDYLSRLPQPRAPLAGSEARLIPDTVLAAYHGLDADGKLLAQARRRFRGDARIAFDPWDLAHGLDDAGETPYDLYLARSGAFSRLDWEEARGVLGAIARHAGLRALVVMDWPGRFSFEGQSRWTKPADGPAVQETASGPAYQASRQEVEALVEDTSRAQKLFLRIASMTDQGIFLGSLGVAAPFPADGPPPLRSLVNRLWEPGLRTPLEGLLVEYTPREGFGSVNAFFLDYTAAWNAVVLGARQILREVPEARGLPAVSPSLQGTVERAQARIRAAARLSLELEIGDPRADFVEPQIAAALRDLELELQRGLGCGSRLMAIAELRKTDSRR